MASRVPLTNLRESRESMSSTISLWDKLPETHPTPIDTIDSDDSLEENDQSVERDDSPEIDLPEKETFYPTPVLRRTSSTSNINALASRKSLWNAEGYDHVKVITHLNQIEEAKKEFQKRLINQGILCKIEVNDKQKISPWHFGLSFVRFSLERARLIDMERLTTNSHLPMFWLRFVNQDEQPRHVGATSNPIHYKNSSSYRLFLRYGALTQLHRFCYSPKHTWSNQRQSNWSLFIKNDYYGGAIEWVITESEKRQKKQLFALNIDGTVVIHRSLNGFTMYICQRCNLNEYHQEKTIKSLARTSDLSRHVNPRRRQLRRPQFNDPCSSVSTTYGPDKRSGQRDGIHFSTVQFEMRLESNSLTDEKAQNMLRRTYDVLMEFFNSHKITVCYADIQTEPVSLVDVFSSLQLPSLVMLYSWQMLLNIGYRFQVQVQTSEQFLTGLYCLSEEEHNADDLFCRVCVYLWRLFMIEPFVNICARLYDAIQESKRKREDSAFGLINTLSMTSNTETYIPSVTLTPTTIRIKPLKLFQTNRIFRAEEQFGAPLEHFLLVDIREENGHPLKSSDFHDLQDLFRSYMKDGFDLMMHGRKYQYLHHSQSQLRTSQFWFYHHEPGVNLSFVHDEVYRWMGKFDREKNVAKYTARIALCFSATIPTIEVDPAAIRKIPDIKAHDGKLIFSDGCGTMSEQLRDSIQEKLGGGSFSVVQFRYAGAKGVVSVDPQLGSGQILCIRPSMDKFDSVHRCFEVCKTSAPRPFHLNQQVIILLSHRRVRDASFLILQQYNHLALIRALLRNSDARNLLDDKLPFWFLPLGAQIDFVREPFFRQLLITACRNSTLDLLKRTRIRVPPNEARNMFGILDEYNVLKPNEVFVQYTVLNDPDIQKKQSTRILHQQKVVITKNPCHHPGDVRTFTAVNYPELRHLRDVVVFSQQGDCPASHQISGSDLDGDEYAVIWHTDLVPHNTENEKPYDYDSQTPSKKKTQPISRNDVINIVLDVVESDFLGRLSRLHLAYADRYGVASTKKPPQGLYSTVELAGVISQEVDSAKTCHHPIKNEEIKRQRDALGDTRPDFMEDPRRKSEPSQNVLGKLYRASRQTSSGWNRLLRRHRHLRHLQIPIPEGENMDNHPNEQDIADQNESNRILLDPTLVSSSRSDQYAEIYVIVRQLYYVYRQEMLEILNLYGLSQESDLWCRKSKRSVHGELEDSAYTQLEQLVQRTRDAFFLRLTGFCPIHPSTCHSTTSFAQLCPRCQKIHSSVAVELYREAYSEQNGSDRVPILSLPWLFTTGLLHVRHNQLLETKGLLSIAMEKALHDLINGSRLQLPGLLMTFRTSHNDQFQATVDRRVCAFLEILHSCLVSKTSWLVILRRFIRETDSSTMKTFATRHDDKREECLLVLNQKTDWCKYATKLKSIEWTMEDDELLHSCFTQILEICFNLIKKNENDHDYLAISEEIILILQRIAIDGTPWPQNP